MPREKQRKGKGSNPLRARSHPVILEVLIKEETAAVVRLPKSLEKESDAKAEGNGVCGRNKQVGISKSRNMRGSRNQKGSRMFHFYEESEK